MHNVVQLCAQAVNKVCTKCAQKNFIRVLLFTHSKQVSSNPHSVLTNVVVVPTFVYSFYTAFVRLLTDVSNEMYTLSTGLTTSTTSLIKIKEIETRG